MTTNFLGMPIIKDLAPHVKPTAANEYARSGFGFGNPIEYITVHQTGNKKRAQMQICIVAIKSNRNLLNLGM